MIAPLCGDIVDRDETGNHGLCPGCREQVDEQGERELGPEDAL